MPGRSWWTPPSAGIALRFNDRIVVMEMMNKLGIAVIDSPALFGMNCYRVPER